jgi:hypothetical protein
MDHDMTDTNASATRTGASAPEDQVMDDAPANAGISTGGGSNMSDNVDESALQNLNVRLRFLRLGRFGDPLLMIWTYRWTVRVSAIPRLEI